MPVAKAALIVPHYNDVDRLIRCLAALMPQMTTDVELVVVDNGSTQSLDGLRRRWPDLRLVVEGEKGAAAARNRGVAETTAPLLFFLDSDCLPARDWLTQAFRAVKTADLVGGRVDVFDETPPPRTGAQAFEAVFAFDNRAYVTAQGFSVTANLVTRRDVFQATGPFRAGLSEDKDWCLRARAKGFRLGYDDALRVGHPSRSDWPALARKWRRLSDEMFALDGQKARRLWALRALLMPLSVLAHLPLVLTSPRLRGGRERLAALGTLARLRLTRMVWMLRQALRGV